MKISLFKCPFGNMLGTEWFLMEMGRICKGMYENWLSLYFKKHFYEKRKKVIEFF